jgi:NAD(P)-dependent dehydrogenase (short-subunit alcohol dehydrogenase family)
MPPTGPVNLTKEVKFAALKDRNVLITGGVSGIGKALVTMFARHGANIVVGDVQDNLGAALEKELGSETR